MEDESVTVLDVSMSNYHRALDHLLRHGARVCPRGVPTLELTNVSLVFRNIRDRLVHGEWRRLNPAFAFTEWLTIMYGDDDLGQMTRILPHYANFSSNGKTVDGAYGPRLSPMFSERMSNSGEIRRFREFNAIDRVIEILRDDPESRRAVMSIYYPEDLVGYGGKNTPCTLTIQFMIRRGALTCTVNMRSNDAILGTCNDVVVFTLIHEFVARQLNVEPGPLVLNAASWHAYEDQIEKFVNTREFQSLDMMSVSVSPMERMPRLTRNDVVSLCELGLTHIDGPYFDELFHKYFDGKSGPVFDWCANVLYTIKSFVVRRDPHAFDEAMRMISSEELCALARRWAK